MLQEGEVREVSRRSIGGRPATVYGYNGNYGVEVRVEFRRQRSMVEVRVELRDLLGNAKSEQRRVYAALEVSSLDGWLDELLRGKKVERIGLFCSPSQRRQNLLDHLKTRYACVVEYRSPVCLADGEQNGELVISFPVDGEMECAQWRDGRWYTTGRPDLLPLPAVWTGMDYSDHTLVEEMVARMVQITVCVLSPPRVILYSDLWNTRLMRRIRFNADSKLHGAVPPLIFRRPQSARRANAFERS